MTTFPSREEIDALLPAGLHVVVDSATGQWLHSHDKSMRSLSFYVTSDDVNGPTVWVDMEFGKEHTALQCADEVMRKVAEVHAGCIKMCNVAAGMYPGELRRVCEEP